MIVGIHQPHFFPWIGYFDKMAKSDVFVLLDNVQLEKGSYMYRNRILNSKGQVEYITISADKHGFLEKKFCDIEVKDNEIWTRKHLNLFESAYKNCDYFCEIMNLIMPLYKEDVNYVCELDIKTIFLIKAILEIKTKIVFQSDLTGINDYYKNDLVLEICKILNADKYLSGNGARKYTNERAFENANIIIKYQDICVPQYKQINSNVFVPGLSVIDMLFNIGIENTKKLFYQNLYMHNEF